MKGLAGRQVHRCSKILHYYALNQYRYLPTSTQFVLNWIGPLPVRDCIKLMLLFDKDHARMTVGQLPTYSRTNKVKKSITRPCQCQSFMLSILLPV